LGGFTRYTLYLFKGQKANFRFAKARGKNLWNHLAFAYCHLPFKKDAASIGAAFMWIEASPHIKYLLPCSVSGSGLSNSQTLQR
jgi:hypothetical protein